MCNVSYLFTLISCALLYFYKQRRLFSMMGPLWSVSQYLSVGCVLVWEQSNFGNPSISVPPHSQADHASITSGHFCFCLYLKISLLFMIGCWVSEEVLLVMLQVFCLADTCYGMYMLHVFSWYMYVQCTLMGVSLINQAFGASLLPYKA